MAPSVGYYRSLIQMLYALQIRNILVNSPVKQVFEETDYFFTASLLKRKKIQQPELPTSSTHTQNTVLKL